MPKPLVTLILLAVVAAVGIGFVLTRGSAVEDDGEGTGDPPPPVRQKRLIDVQPGPIYFVDATAESGVDFRHVSGNAVDKPFPAANGSGLAALDYDLDGLYDLYCATGRSFPVNEGAGPANRMFRNRGGWRFEDVSAATGLDFRGYSAGLAVGDFDGDGFPDVYVTCFGKNRLFQNQGDGTFVDVSRESLADDARWATSACFFDADGDGLLDVYICNYGKWTYETNRFCGNRSRNVRIFCSPHTVPGERDTFLHNNGDGTFGDWTEQAGLAGHLSRGQGVVAADFDADGDVDLYLGNDLHANSLFLNDGFGRFTDATERSGVGYSDKGGMQAGMGVDAADVNRSGRLDLLVTNFEREHNAFYEHGAGGLFQEVSAPRGLAAPSLPWVGWGVILSDYDLDGWIDAAVVNGHVDDNLKDIGRDAPYAEPALMLRNTGGRFQSLGASAGGYFGSSHPARALASADFDNDGDADLAAGHQDAGPALLNNQRVGGNNDASVVLHLVGRRGNRDAVGSIIRWKRSDGASLMQQVKGGASYLSAHDLRQILAVDTAETNVEVDWCSGTKSTLRGLRIGGRYRIIEPPAADSAAAVIHVPGTQP